MQRPSSTPTNARLLQLCSLGFDVLVYYPDLLSLWIPQRASRHAAAVLSLIAQELTATGPRPLIFAPFSGAAKVSGSVYTVNELQCGAFVEVPSHLQAPSRANMCSVYATSCHIAELQCRRCLQRSILRNMQQVLPFTLLPTPLVSSYNLDALLQTCYYKMLQMLATPGTSAEAQARNKLILSCCAGQIFDSGPVDFTSEAVSGPAAKEQLEHTAPGSQMLAASRQLAPRMLSVCQQPSMLALLQPSKQL